jgi:hypothetical protein
LLGVGAAWTAIMAQKARIMEGIEDLMVAFGSKLVKYV